MNYKYNKNDENIFSTNVSVTYRAEVNGACDIVVSKCRLGEVNKRKRIQATSQIRRHISSTKQKLKLNRYLKSVYQDALQLLNKIRKNSTLQRRAKNKAFLRFCSQLQKYTCACSGIHLWFIFLIKIMQIIISFYKDSPHNEHREAAANLAKKTAALRQLYTTYRSCPKRMKGKPTSSSNYSVINILLIPENSPYFEKMAREAMRNIVAFNDTHETKFLIIEFNKNRESLKSALSRYVSRGTACKFYVFGHEQNGSVGSWKRQFLRIKELLRCLDDLCIGCQFSTSVTLTCCNGHLYSRYNYKKIIIDYVTSNDAFSAVYFGKLNLSFMCHLFTKHVRSRYFL